MKPPVPVLRRCRTPDPGHVEICIYNTYIVSLQNYITRKVWIYGVWRLWCFSILPSHCSYHNSPSVPRIEKVQPLIANTRCELARCIIRRTVKVNNKCASSIRDRSAYHINELAAKVKKRVSSIRDRSTHHTCSRQHHRIVGKLRMQMQIIDNEQAAQSSTLNNQKGPRRELLTQVWRQLFVGGLCRCVCYTVWCLVAEYHNIKRY